MIPPDRAIEAVDVPGLVPYADGLERQFACRKALETGAGPQTLLLLEHAPVLTLGRNAHEDNLLHSPAEYAALGIDLVKTDRGGDVTYHGPGQLTAYPILDLRRWRLSLRWYLRMLEETTIRTLADYGLVGERIEPHTGVWVNGAKVAQVGVGVRNWFTYHGVAINVDPDMAHFGLIVPCGIADKPVASMAPLLGRSIAVAEVAERFSNNFATLFGAWDPESDPAAPATSQERANP